MQEVTTKMREKGINNMQWIDREEWRRKIKFQAQENVQTSVFYINKIVITSLYHEIY